MYLDEFGKSMVRTCYSTEHGHPAPMGMAPGEGIPARQIREAIPPEIATYLSSSSDVMTQYLMAASGTPHSMAIGMVIPSLPTM